jgi:hypothetical protein
MMKRPFPVVLALVAVTTALALTFGSRETAAAQTCNPSDPDDDGDGLSDSCDPSPTSWDGDIDLAFDSMELFAGSDPSNWCSHPFDASSKNGHIQIDDVSFVAGAFGKRAGDDGYYPSAEPVSRNDVVQIDDVSGVAGQFGEWCPFYIQSPAFPGAPPELHSETSDSDLASYWYTDHAEIYSEASGVYKTLYCSEFEDAAKDWTNYTNFHFSVGYDGGGECDVAGTVGFNVTYEEDEELAAYVVLYSYQGIPCSTSNPCLYAHFARMFMNANHPQNASIDYRHIVFTHELGHVLAQGDISGCPPWVWSIMFDTTQCLWNAGLHWPRANDIIFTNIKY